MKAEFSSLLRSAFCLSAIFIVTLIDNPLYAQSGELTKVVPPSPNAASLGKFADTPVGYYTGTPQINVPLFEIAEGDVKLPISLDYHAGGVKVEETASPVGIGWALQAGGVITRVERGGVDEQTVAQQPWINGLYAIPTDADPVAHAQYWGLAVRGALDTEPDLYFYNFAGRTGKFFFDNLGNTHLVPFQKLKITPSWTIKGEDGTVYVFSKTEETKPVTSCNGNMGASVMPYTSAWYLTEIRPFNTNGKITLEYDTYETSPGLYNYRTIASSTRYAVLSQNGTTQLPNIENTDCETRIFLDHPARLKRIKSSTALVEFVYGAERCDLKGDYMLDEIVYKRKNKDNTYTLVKRFKLMHKYMSGLGLVDINSPCTPTNSFWDLTDYSKRLTLVGLSEIGVNEEFGKEHRFEYYLQSSDGKTLPSRLSYNQDHWGYFNGSLNDGGIDRTLIPANPQIPNGAFRQCNELSAQVGTLKSITYPTNGRTDFEYELHDINNRGGFKFDVLYRQSQTLGIQPALETYGQIRVSDTFKVQSTTGSVIAKIQFGFMTDCNARPCSNLTVNPFCQDYFNFEIWKYSGNDSILIKRFYPSDYYLTNYPLENGIYKIAHVVKVSTNVYLNAFCHPYTFNVECLNNSIRDVAKIGGLRVKKIIDVTPDDPLNKKVRIFAYRENGKSSGTVVNYPVYSYDRIEDYRTRFDFGSTSVVQTGTRTMRVFTSSSSQPLGTTQGSPVGYSTVTVYYGEEAPSGVGINGKTIYKYTDPYMYPDKQSVQSVSDIPSYSTPPTYPFAPIDSQDWLRGLLLERSDYSRDGSAYKIKRRIKNSYNYYKNRYELSSWKVGTSRILYSYMQSRESLVMESWDFLPTVSPTFLPTPFKMRSGYNEMSQSIDKVYDETDTTKFTTTTTDYVYSDDHLQLIEKKVTNSDNRVTRILTKYPSDFTSATTDSDWASAAMAKMKELNRIAVPVENLTMVNDKLVGGSIIKFKEFQPDKIFPHERYEYRTSEPVENAPPSQIVNGQLTFEAFTNGQGFEKDMVYTSFNEKGQLISSQKANSRPVSYVWDYFNTLPIAEVINAAPTDVAYTGFEYDATGNWTVGSSYNITDKFTGSASYTISTASTISKSGLDVNNRYVVSFWSRSGVPTINGVVPTEGESANGWTFYETTVAGVASVTIAGSGVIDELRLYPADAQMKTYTYEPGVGVITTTDFNSLPTYYEYDGLSRLAVIKDHKGSIVKTYQYNYQVK